ncbi:MAG TPA: S8 family peptidase [Gemmatimonadales bacterium]|nr:S8 family peptidase [Gemmatimonadales bacterium]
MLSTPRSLGFVLAAILGAMLVPGCRPDEGPSGPSELSEVSSPQLRSGQTIPGEYIVVFKRSLPDPAREARAMAAQHGGTLRFTYSSALKGFAAALPPQALEAIRRNPNVAYVEADQVVELFGGTQPAPPSWGLDRLDQRTLPLSASYSWGTSGAGVSVYIIDTGIRTTHQDFGGRAVWDFNAIRRDPETDCNGHGTHVAGTVGGTIYGVAKGVTLHAVKVLDCAGSGRWSGVIAGIDWVTANAVKPAVANMSIGGEYNQAVNDAVASSVASGITYSIAAGNSSSNACTFSPASEPTALTVGATTKLDAVASYSNIGPCVDVFAPGSWILSDWNSSDTEAVYLSGTSMATPHVTGAVALYLESHPSAAPTEVSAALLAGATQNVVTGLPAGAANFLLFTGDPNTPTSGGGGPAPCVPNRPRSKNCK